jgi:hypothetical protein
MNYAKCLCDLASNIELLSKREVSRPLRRLKNRCKGHAAGVGHGYSHPLGFYFDGERPQEGCIFIKGTQQRGLLSKQVPLSVR